RSKSQCMKKRSGLGKTARTPLMMKPLRGNPARNLGLEPNFRCNALENVLAAVSLEGPPCCAHYPRSGNVASECTLPKGVSVRQYFAPSLVSKTTDGSSVTSGS